MHLNQPYLDGTTILKSVDEGLKAYGDVWCIYISHIEQISGDLRPAPIALWRSSTASDRLPKIRLISTVSGPDLAWFFDALANADASRDVAVEDAMKIMDGIFKLIAAKEFQVLGSLLRNTELHKLDSTSLVTFARSTSSFRNAISTWNAFLREVASLLTQRGKEPTRVLRGLV